MTQEPTLQAVHENDARTGERLYEARWTPVEEAAEAYRTLGGLEILKRVVAGSMPIAPFVDILGARLIEIDHGSAVFEVAPGGHHYNPIGTVHGGLSATLIDSATGCAVYSTLGAEDRWTTLDLHVNFVRPITAEHKRVVCTGALIHIGGRIATAEGRVTDDDGRLYAHGVSTCMIQRAAAPKG